MKKHPLLALGLLLLLSACSPKTENPNDASSAEGETAAALCEFNTIDSATAISRLPGKWALKGMQSNYMGAKEDEFLTGEQLGDPRELVFYANGEYEEFVNGQRVGERQQVKVVGQSLPPLGYQFWFCGENTLIFNNIIADGGTEVFIRQK